MVARDESRSLPVPQLCAARHRDRQRDAGERPQGGAAEGHDGLPGNLPDLLLEPDVAGVDLAQSGLLMQTPFAAWLPLEVLDGVGDVDGTASKTRLLDRLIEQAPCRADERT